MSLTWELARDHCRSLNSHLAVIEDTQELQALQSFLRKNKQRSGNLDVWVGSKKAGDGQFYWEVCSCESHDKEKCEYSLPVDPELFRPGLPDNYGGHENWVELDVQCDAMLNDNNNVRQAFLCEYEL